MSEVKPPPQPGGVSVMGRWTRGERRVCMPVEDARAMLLMLGEALSKQKSYAGDMAAKFLEDHAADYNDIVFRPQGDNGRGG